MEKEDLIIQKLEDLKRDMDSGFAALKENISKIELVTSKNTVDIAVLTERQEACAREAEAHKVAIGAYKDQTRTTLNDLYGKVNGIGLKIATWSGGIAVLAVLANKLIGKL